MTVKLDVFTKKLLAPVTDRVLDDWSEWMKCKRAQYLYTAWRNNRGDKMAAEFRIEIRVDFTDRDKFATMKQQVQNLARNLYATANLLKDSQAPVIMICGDDFFHPTEEIKLFDDVIQQGADQLKAINPDAPAEEEISQELIDAMRDMNRKDK